MNATLANALETADRLISKYGAVSQWTKYNATVNNAQPWKSSDPGSPTTYNVLIVLLPEGTGLNPMQALQMLIAGTSVPGGSEQGLMSGKVPFVPAINDKVTIAGITRMIKDFDVLRPDGTPLLYTLSFA